MPVKPPQILAPKSALKTPAALGALEAEVLEEKTATLARLTQAFESAYAAWQAEEAEAAAGNSSSERQRGQLFDLAADALWHFVVQREVCGLRNTEAVLRQYRVPAALRLRMGAIRQR